MAITTEQVAQVASELKRVRGGVNNDYFGLLFLEEEFGLPRDRASEQIAYGGNDFGIDGYHIDRQARNLYVYQFKFSQAADQFVGSMQRLISAGLARVFNARSQQVENPILREIRSALYEQRSVIDKVYLDFVFTGDPDKAQNSEAIQKLREDIESRSYVTQAYFERPVPIIVRFRSTSKKGHENAHTPLTFDLNMSDDLSSIQGPDGQRMHVGFVKLLDLHAMYSAMGERFLDRNIRFFLSGRKPGEETSVNRHVMKAFEEMTITRKSDPAVFAFNHNGVTLYAEMIEGSKGNYRVTEPRLLNGAQTLGSFKAFMGSHVNHAVLSQSADRLAEIKVMCKVIVQSEPDFITNVTICNNRQNPVEPWNLRANDMIQLQLADRFKELGLYYERQKNAFEHFSDQELQGQGLDTGVAIELVRLAQTFLVTDGSIATLSRMTEFFESDKSYEQVFSRSRLTADVRAICLCYKLQFKLRPLVQSILAKGQNKYAFMPRARTLLWALMCQAMLNHPDFDEYAEEYGRDLRHPHSLMDWWDMLAANTCRLIIADLIELPENQPRVKEGNFSFLRTNAAFERAMEIGRKRNRKWVHTRLK